MRREYDFTDSIPNPHAKHSRKRVTICLGTDVVAYFKALAKETGVPYQNLINLYFRDCVNSGKRLSLKRAGFRGSTRPRLPCEASAKQGGKPRHPPPATRRQFNNAF
jgi:hypothetical protein